MRVSVPILCFTLLVAASSGLPTVQGQLCVDEQKQIRWHDSRDILQFFTNAGPAPVTVATEDPQTPDRFLSLDEAIQLALRHSEVIRVLTGVSATATGSTIYDTAIATTAIDQAVGRFDPIFFANSTYRDAETPVAGPSLANPLIAQIFGTRIATNQAAIGTNKTNRLGGQAAFSFSHNWTRNHFNDGNPAFNPSERPSMELSYTQPLLAGGGREANAAPIVIARLEQDRSYFQYKDSMQRQVNSVIAGYWALVNARTNLWAREQQYNLLKFALERVEARVVHEIDALAQETQARVAFANIRANVIAAQADVLQREAALRNVLGLPPEDGVRLVPSTPPTRDELEFVWQELFDTAQFRRPDLIELNLILQADLQRLIQSRNLARPSLDATAIHRWNGLRGTILGGQQIASSPGDNTEWAMGVTFSVPVGMRTSRAQLRSTELLISRDRASIQQGLHATRHEIATNIRNLDLAFRQYQAFQDTRKAAVENLQLQVKSVDIGVAEFLVILQAISDWGNAVSSEGAALSSYNSELANLENATGSILETHSIFFVEERYASIGPFGRKHEDHCYPRDLRALRNTIRYDDSGEAAEEAFDLQDFEPLTFDTPIEEPEWDDEDEPESPMPVTPDKQASAVRFFRPQSLQKLFR